MLDRKIYTQIYIFSYILIYSLDISQKLSTAQLLRIYELVCYVIIEFAKFSRFEIVRVDVYKLFHLFL